MSANNFRMRLLLAGTVVTLLTLGSVESPAWAQSSQMTKKEVKELISKAHTSADHQRLADHYAQEASRFEAEAKEHFELAEAYAHTPNAHESKHPNSGATAGHCRTMAERYSGLAKEAKALSALHAGMAKANK
jgi:ABC-type branched-subunit amino acid transport system ATPase component